MAYVVEINGRGVVVVQRREVGIRRDTMEQIAALVYVIAMAIPVAKVLQRTGFSTWWMLLIFFPVINIVGF